MRALLKRDANIIEVAKDYVVLDSITSDGYFVYKVKYRVDPVKAIRSKAFQVIISVTDRPQIRRQIKTFTNFNPTAINKRLRLKKSMSKDILRQEISNRILTIISDITKKIPNNKTINLSKAHFTNSPVLNTSIKIRPALVETLRNQNLTLPVLDRNITRLPSLVHAASLINAKPDFRSSATRLITNSRKDPAILVGSKTNSISSATRAINGTTSNQSPSTHTKLKLGTQLVSSLLNQKNYNNQFQLKSSVYVNVPIKEENTWIEVEETIYIPIGDLPGDEFFFTFELQNDKKLDVQTITRPVFHGENLSKLQIPTEAPEIVALSVGGLGRTTLNVKQKDKNATKIKLYRRELNKGTATIDAQYDFVGEIDAKSGEDFKKVDDLFASTNPVIYRAIAVNGNDILGAEFGSVVVEQRRLPFKRGKFKRQPYFASLSQEIQGRSILVTIRDISPGPIALRLLRRDLSIKQKSFTNVSPGGQNSETILIEKNSNTPIVIEDSNVKGGRTYEYKTLLIFDNGTEETSANNLIVDFDPISSNVLELNMSEPSVEQDGNDIDITFTIQKNIIQTQGDLVKSFLEEQGLTTEYQDQLLANRDKLQNLFGVKVTRTNLTTGEIEDFGIIPNQNFSDKNFGRVRSVQPLQAGFDYQYNITAHARETDGLFSSLTKIVTPRTNVSYSFSPNKWYHPVTLTQGNLITPQTLLKNHSKSTFTFGKVVDSKSVVVSLADVLPSLYSGKAAQLGKNKTLVQWKVQGDVNKIDHFIVILEILGMRTIVGKSHNITNSNYFQFVDNLTNQECGELTYYIIPVFFDYSRGPEHKTNSVII